MTGREFVPYLSCLVAMVAGREAWGDPGAFPGSPPLLPDPVNQVFIISPNSLQKTYHEYRFADMSCYSNELKRWIGTAPENLRAALFLTG